MKDDRGKVLDEFQCGDRVRVVQPKEPLLRGGTYEIAHIIEGKIHLTEFPSFRWYPCRFEKVLTAYDWEAAYKAMAEEAIEKGKIIAGLEERLSYFSEVVDEEVCGPLPPMKRCSPHLKEHIANLRCNLRQAAERADYWHGEHKRYCEHYTEKVKQIQELQEALAAQTEHLNATSDRWKDVTTCYESLKAGVMQVREIAGLPIDWKEHGLMDLAQQIKALQAYRDVCDGVRDALDIPPDSSKWQADIPKMIRTMKIQWAEAVCKMRGEAFEIRMDETAFRLAEENEKHLSDARKLLRRFGLVWRDNAYHPEDTSVLEYEQPMDVFRAPWGKDDPPAHAGSPDEHLGNDR